MGDRPPNKRDFAKQLFMDAPRQKAPTEQTVLRAAIREMTPEEILRRPRHTLTRIHDTLDLLILELERRFASNPTSVDGRDIKSFTEIARVYTALKQTQLAEDQAARATHAHMSDEQIAEMLLQAFANAGPKARAMLEAALKDETNE